MSNELRTKDLNRNITIDVLRMLGTLMVILAHVNAPTGLQTVRSFDVCLLVMISGYCCSVKDEPYFAYARKRIRRLAVPAWVTMTVVFVLAGALCVVAHREYLFSMQQIAETYLFLGGREGGIGLFWIVRIYLLMSLLAPVFCRINKKISSKMHFLGIVLGLVILNEILFKVLWGIHPILDGLLENFVLSALAYSAVYLVGMRLNSNKADSVLIMAAFAVLTTVSQIYIRLSVGEYIVADAKYPPQLSYIAYGIAGSLSVFLLMDTVLKRSKITKLPAVVQWFSKNSFQIYLAHAVVLKLLSWGDRVVSRIPILKHWLVVYCVVLVVSCLMVLVIQWFIGRIRFSQRRV